MENLQGLIVKCEKEGNVEDIKTLINCYETNRAGWLLNRYKDEVDVSFTSSIDNSRFEQDFDDIGSKIETIVKSHLRSIRESGDNNTIPELTSVMEILLEEMDLYRECNKTKPISKTQITFDVYGLMQTVNDALIEAGADADEYVVDTEMVPSLDEYRLTMKQIVANALIGANAIDSEDVNKAINAMSLLRGRGEMQNDK